MSDLAKQKQITINKIVIVAGVGKMHMYVDFVMTDTLLRLRSATRDFTPATPYIAMLEEISNILGWEQIPYTPLR